jgi:hypothetical protein
MGPKNLKKRREMYLHQARATGYPTYLLTVRYYGEFRKKYLNG